MRIKGWRTAKRSTNVTCDPIDKWSQRKTWNGTDEMQWAVPIRSQPMRPLVTVFELGLVDETRCSSACFLEHVESLGPSSSSDEHHCSYSSLGTGMLVVETKAPLSLSCVFGLLASAIQGGRHLRPKPYHLYLFFEKLRSCLRPKHGSSLEKVTLLTHNTRWPTSFFMVIAPQDLSRISVRNVKK